MDEIGHKKGIPPHVQEHFASQKQSGLTIKDYCREHSLSCETFYGWRTVYINKPAQQKGPLFKEIDVIPEHVPVCDVHFPSGTLVSVYRGARESDLQPIFKLLDAQETC
jgi:hypothetical protein